MQARGGDTESTGPDLSSIPGVGGSSLHVDHTAVPGRGRRRRIRPAVFGMAALILVPAAAAGQFTGNADRAGDQPGVTFRAAAADPVADDRAALAPPPEAEPQVPAPSVFARFRGLDLHLPSRGTLLVGFHEASYADARAFTPVGDAVANENPTKFQAPATDPDGPEYVVLSSRGRVHPATSAADIVLRDDTPVLAVVSGTVTDVRPYLLYGKYEDTRIEIAPHDRPDLRVVMIHVSDVTVRAGDDIEAGVTPLAGGPNRFPFASHIDRYFEQDRWPHVHVEVKRA
jgi:hypothetical protein